MVQQGDTTAFTVREGRRSGLTAHELRSRQYVRPFHGVRTPAGAVLDTVRARAEALAVRLDARTFFSHSTAAALIGMPLPWSLSSDTELEICVFQPARAPQLANVRSHEVKPTGQAVVNIDGLRCIAPEDAWAQMANTLSLEGLVIAADWLVTGDEPYSGKTPLSSVEALDCAIGRHGRMRGVRKLRLARDLTRYGSLSPQETRLRLLLSESRFPEPALNYRVRDASGDVLAMVDLAYPERRVAIEYLGDHHRTDIHTYRKDIRRRDILAIAGWSVLFTTADDLQDPRLFLTHLRRQLASTG